METWALTLVEDLVDVGVLEKLASKMWKFMMLQKTRRPRLSFLLFYLFFSSFWDLQKTKRPKEISLIAEARANLMATTGGATRRIPVSQGSYWPGGCWEIWSSNEGPPWLHTKAAKAAFGWEDRIVMDFFGAKSFPFFNPPPLAVGFPRPDRCHLVSFSV